MVENDIINIFPTAILSADLGRKITEKELETIKFLLSSPIKNTGNLTSREGHVFDNPVFSELKKFCYSKLVDYFKKIISPSTEVDIQITQSWLNSCEPNEFHHKHNHPNSFLSGVFYISTNENDCIIFDKDVDNAIVFSVKEYNNWNCNTWWLPAIEGRLYIFPSSVQHFVEPVVGSKTRISLSFNSFPKGIIGNETDRTLLKL